MSKMRYMAAVRVLLVDDHLVFAEALSVRLGAEPDIEVVGLAATAHQAESVAQLPALDVAVVDIDLGATDGIDLIRWLGAHCPRVGIVVLTGHDDGHTASAALRAGASGFVAKGAAVEELVDAVQAVHRGQTWVRSRLLIDVLRDSQAGSSGSRQEEALSRLSAREREVLALMVSGNDRAAIARRLFLSPNTVRTHTQRILAKLDAHSSVEAVGIALAAGLRPRHDGPDGAGRSPSGTVPHHRS